MTNLEVNGLGLEELSQKEAKSIDGGLPALIAIGGFVVTLATYSVARRVIKGDWWWK